MAGLCALLPFTRASLRRSNPRIARGEAEREILAVKPLRNRHARLKPSGSAAAPEASSSRQLGRVEAVIMEEEGQGVPIATRIENCDRENE